MIAGCEHPADLAYEVRGTLRGKRPQLELALNGRITDHHRFLLGELLDDLERTEGKIQRLEAEIARRVDLQAVERLCSLPGVDVITSVRAITRAAANGSAIARVRGTAGCAAMAQSAGALRTRRIAI